MESAFIINSKTINALRKCKAKNSLRRLFNNVWVLPKDNDALFIATDGHVMAVYNTSKDISVCDALESAQVAYILPDSNVKSDNLCIAINGDKILFHHDNGEKESFNVSDEEYNTNADSLSSIKLILSKSLKCVSSERKEPVSFDGKKIKLFLTLAETITKKPVMKIHNAAYMAATIITHSDDNALTFIIMPLKQ
jgi:DNA polymerase III sliding clamp (beta) subunit (PCNA family)